MSSSSRKRGHCRVSVQKCLGFSLRATDGPDGPAAWSQALARPRSCGVIERFLDRREGPNVPVSNYPTSPIIGDRRGDAKVHNAHPRLRAKGDRVHRSQAQFSEHDAVVEHIASGHEGSTLWKSLVTTGSSMTVVRSRMSCKCWRCWRRPARPYGPRSHNKYSSPLTCNHDEPTIRTHSNP